MTRSARRLACPEGSATPSHPQEGTSSTDLRSLPVLRAQGLAERTIAPRVRRWGDLSDAERREIELSENFDRNDFTPYERSRQIVALAETAAGDQEQCRSGGVVEALLASP
jgi:hypothetical protein